MKVVRAIAGRLVGATLGQTIYNYLAAIALIGLLLFGSYVLITGKFWHWRADVANKRADNAEAAAEISQGNADRANGAAENATFTREQMDAGKLDIHVTTTAAAERAEKYDPTNDPDFDGGVSDDLVRELEAAKARAGAASNRLQRKGSSR